MMRCQRRCAPSRTNNLNSSNVIPGTRHFISSALADFTQSEWERTTGHWVLTPPMASFGSGLEPTPSTIASSPDNRGGAHSDMVRGLSGA